MSQKAWNTCCFSTFQVFEWDKVHSSFGGQYLANTRLVGLNSTTSTWQLCDFEKLLLSEPQSYLWNGNRSCIPQGCCEAKTAGRESSTQLLFSLISFQEPPHKLKSMGTQVPYRKWCSTVGPLFLRLLHSQIQPTMDGNLHPRLVESADAKQNKEGRLYLLKTRM